MAAALTTVVVPARTMVIGIANGTTTMADIIAEAGAIIHQVAIGPGMVASEAGQFKTASASHIAATEIHLEIEAAEVGGLFNSVA